jgi:hypothetical protein
MDIFSDTSILGIVFESMSAAFVRRELQLKQKNSIRLVSHAFRVAYDLSAKKSISSKTIHLFDCFLHHCNLYNKRQNFNLEVPVLGSIHAIQFNNVPDFNKTIDQLFTKYPTSFQHLQGFNVSTALVSSEIANLDAKRGIRKTILNILAVQVAKKRDIVWNFCYLGWHCGNIDQDAKTELKSISSHVKHAALFQCLTAMRIIRSLETLSDVSHLHLICHDDIELPGNRPEHNNACYNVTILTMEIQGGHFNMIRSLCFDAQRKAKGLFPVGEEITTTLAFKNVTCLRFIGEIHNDFFTNMYMPDVKELYLINFPVNDNSIETVGWVINRLICTALPGVSQLACSTDRVQSTSLLDEYPTLLVELFSSIIQKQRPLTVVVDSCMFELMLLGYESDIWVDEKEYYDMGSQLSDYKILFNRTRCCSRSVNITCQCMGSNDVLYALCPGCARSVTKQIAPL